MVSSDMGLVSMVRQGILALQLLPPNSSAGSLASPLTAFLAVASASHQPDPPTRVSGIIIITDGVMSVPDVVVCETLLNQLRSGTITCSFVQVLTPVAAFVLNCCTRDR